MIYTQLEIFLMVLSTIFTLRHIVPFIIEYKSDDPKPIHLSNIDKRTNQWAVYYNIYSYS